MFTNPFRRRSNDTTPPTTLSPAVPPSGDVMIVQTEEFARHVGADIVVAIHRWGQTGARVVVASEYSVTGAQIAATLRGAADRFEGLE